MDQVSAPPFTTEIHPEDHLYGYLSKRFGNEAARKMYFDGGKSDATQVSKSIKQFKKENNINVLEFASGYGRITRHLRSLIPEAALHACDIHAEACEFLSEQIGVETFVSSARPEAVKLGKEFDFIFVISLFSHLPDWSFKRWIHVLADMLSPNGILLFTTHGDRSKALQKGVDFTQHEGGHGWAYIRRSDQPDIDFDDYGTMLVAPHYVADAIADCRSLSLRSFTSAAWFGHQDEWVVQRVS